MLSSVTLLALLGFSFILPYVENGDDDDEDVAPSADELEMTTELPADPDPAGDTDLADAERDLPDFSGDDVLYGDALANELHGGDGADELRGAGGDDLLEGGTGNDMLDGGFGADTLAGGAGDDDLRGDPGDDSLSGGEGADTLRAGDGNDMLDGGLGADQMQGGLGDDTLQLDAGDFATGGEGADVFETAGGSGLITIGDFDPGADALVLQTGGDPFLQVTDQTITPTGLDITLSDGTVLRLPGVSAEVQVTLV